MEDGVSVFRSFGKTVLRRSEICRALQTEHWKLRAWRGERLFEGLDGLERQFFAAATPGFHQLVEVQAPPLVDQLQGF